MTDQDTRRQLLLNLANLYEDGKHHYMHFEPASADPLARTLVAGLRAEGSVEEMMGSIRFTDQGYNKYKAEIASSEKPARPPRIVGARRLLFLGAGASKSLGKMLMGEFVEWLMKQNPPEPELLKCICEKNKDLEYLLEQLEQLASMAFLTEYFKRERANLVPPELRSDVESVPTFAAAADNLFRWVKHQVFRHYREMVLPLWYQKAFENLLQLLILPDWPLVIFTTNYDPVVEEFCRLAQGWSLCAGLTNDAAVGEYYWSRRAYEEFTMEPGGRAIILFKLHGSTTWVRQGRRILKSPAFYTGDDVMCENVMIFPATRKVAIEDPYFTGYDYLEKCLSAAQLCLVVGYSFRDYDTLMRFKAAKLSNPALEIHLIDPLAHIIKEQMEKNDINAEPLSLSGFETETCLKSVQRLVGQSPG
jgi:hypothetical protein